MSDDSTWRPSAPDGDESPPPPPPPTSPTSPPVLPPTPPSGPSAGPSAGPSFGPPTGPPDDPAAVDAGPPERRRSPLGLAAAAIAVVLIGVAGVFAVTRIMGGDEGGAASPEELADKLFTAIDESDVLGLADLILPSERDTFVDPLTEIVDELRRLEVISPAAGADGIEGVTFEVTRTSVRVRSTNVDDIVNLDLNADVTVTIDGDRLPIGDLLVDLIDDVDRSELDVRETEPLDLTLTAVEEGGRWYLSALFTIAETVRADMSPRPDIPATGIEPRGGDTPEGAVEALLAGIERLDLDQIVAALNPGEASVLHRYGPAFLGDAQTELDLVPLRWEVTDVDLVATGSGSTRTVGVERLAIEGRFDGAPFEIELADGCLRAEAEGERFDSCEDAADEFSLDDILGDSAAAEEMIALLEGIAVAYEPTGITVREVDGQWFVSPVGILFDQLLAVLRSIDRDDIERFVELVPEVLGDVFGGDPFVFDDEFFDDEFFDDEFGDDPFDDFGEGESTEDDPFAPSRLDECFTLADVDEAIECFELAVEDGEIAPFDVPIELRHPECGAAEVSWQGYFELSDDEFIEFVERVRPCFLDLVAAGELSEFDLPLALSDPDCFEGRNWYAVFDDPEYDDRVFECIGF